MSSDRGPEAGPERAPESVPTPDPRPRPQYGEYATPEEVARARGIPLDRGANEHVERLSTPIPPVLPSSKKGSSKNPSSSTSASPEHQPWPGLRNAAQPSGRPLSTRHPGQASPLMTVLLLVFGIWNTVTSIPSFLDLGASLQQGLEAAGYGTVVFGAAAHVVGIVLLVFSFLVLIAAVGFSFRRIREGRTSIWIPLLAAGVWVVGLIVGMIVVVANTPGLTALLQNHS